MKPSHLQKLFLQSSWFLSLFSMSYAQGSSSNSSLSGALSTSTQQNSSLSLFTSTTTATQLIPSSSSWISASSQDIKIDTSTITTGIGLSSLPSASTQATHSDISTVATGIGSSSWNSTSSQDTQSDASMVTLGISLTSRPSGSPTSSASNLSEGPQTEDSCYDVYENYEVVCVIPPTNTTFLNSLTQYTLVETDTQVYNLTQSEVETVTEYGSTRGQFTAFTLTGPTTFVTVLTETAIFSNMETTTVTGPLNYMPVPSYEGGGGGSFACLGTLPTAANPYSIVTYVQPGTTWTSFFKFASMTVNGTISMSPIGQVITVSESTTTRAEIPYVDNVNTALPDCCGGCSVYFPSVDLFYWPVATADASCLIQTDGGSSGSMLAMNQSDSFPANNPMSVVGPDGFTYISPSAYVAFHNVAASNLCGQVGGVHTSITLAFAPGQLSSVWGETLPAGERFLQVISSSFNFGDLPCPPQSALNGPWLNYPVPLAGAGYRPRLALPPQLLALDPAWNTCITDIWQGIDPPTALPSVSALNTVMTAGNPPPISTPPSPIQSISALPANTKPIMTQPVSTTSTPQPLNQPSLPSTGRSVDPTSSVGPASSPATSNVQYQVPSASADPSMAQSSPSSTIPTVVANGNPVSGDLTAILIPGSVPAYTSGLTNVELNSDPVPTMNQHQSQTYSPVVVGGFTFSPFQSSSQITAPVQASAVTYTGYAVGQTVYFEGSTAQMGSQTIVQGEPPVTISGTPVSLGTAVLVVGSITYQRPVIGSSTINSDPFSTPSVITAATQVSTGIPTGFVVAGNTLVPGGSGITISGTPVSLNPLGDIVVGSTMISPNPTDNPAVLTFAEQTFTAVSNGLIIGSQTLSANGPGITLSGTPIYLGTSGNLIIGTSTLSLMPSGGPKVLTVAGEIFTPASNALIIGGQTLSPGGTGITVSGVPMSLDGLDNLIVGTSTFTLQTTGSPKVFTIGGQTFIAAPNGFMVGSQTLSPGGPGMTISGTPVSLDPSGDLILGASTIPLNTGSPKVFTVAGQIFTAAPTGFAAASKTLLPGGPGVTISGTPVSLDPSGELIIGSSTIPLGPVTSHGLGSLIMSGFGYENPSTSGGAPTSTGGNATLQPFEGGQSKLDVRCLLWSWVVATSILFILWFS
ncbi:MAG: hypothetical protein M1827_006160 [Pycnora praestabilis]|nr:MAG: hypothetical protein M1827_006160 [Pycnora praestabilis]